MQIEKKGAGPWPTVSVDGTTVSITACGETRSYDCNALQGDAQVVLDIVRTADGGLAEGVANGVEYVASLIIPASRVRKCSFARDAGGTGAARRSGSRLDFSDPHNRNSTQGAGGNRHGSNPADTLDHH